MSILDLIRVAIIFFLFATASKPALGTAQRPNRLVPEALSPAVKRPWCKPDRSPPPYIFMEWCLIKQ